jgi:hypothetical protein
VAAALPGQVPAQQPECAGTGPSGSPLQATVHPLNTRQRCSTQCADPHARVWCWRCLTPRTRVLPQLRGGRWKPVAHGLHMLDPLLKRRCEPRVQAAATHASSGGRKLREAGARASGHCRKLQEAGSPSPKRRKLQEAGSAPGGACGSEQPLLAFLLRQCSSLGSTTPATPAAKPAAAAAAPSAAAAAAKPQAEPPAKPAAPTTKLPAKSTKRKWEDESGTFALALHTPTSLLFFLWNLGRLRGRHLAGASCTQPTMCIACIGTVRPEGGCSLLV